MLVCNKGTVAALRSRFMSSKTIFHPCIDGIFQYGFESSTAVKSFLNAALNFTGEKEIQEIEHFRKDMPSNIPGSQFAYNFTVDLRCRTKDGHHFLVEMQNDFRDDYHMKTLIEHSRMLSGLDTYQGEDDKAKRISKNVNDGSKFWKGIEGVYTVVVTNKAFDRSRMKSFYSNETLMEPMLLNAYELRHVKQLDRRFGDIPNQIILLMLDNFNKAATELEDPIEDWAYIFKDKKLKSGAIKIPETKEIDNMELIADRNPGIKEFTDRIDVNNLPSEVREYSLRHIHYYNSTILDIENVRRAEGEAKCFATMVQSMRSNGCSDEKISTLCNMPLEKVSEVPRK